MLERLFHLKDQRTTVRTEVVAGLTTFMTMAYIIAVNPSILAGTAAQPGPLGPGLFAATVTATCLGAALPTVLMGLWANYPIALASGMGLNAALATSVATGRGITWQVMMGVIFLEGLIITVLVLTNVREKVMAAIPLDLKRSIAAGIGLFIALLGLHNAHWMSSGPGGAPMTVPPVGSFHTAGALVSAFGLLLTAGLMARKVRGALLVGIVMTTIVAILTGVAHQPAAVAAAPDFRTIGRLDILGALKPALFAAIFAFLISDFFDTMGTVVAVSEQAGVVRTDGTVPRLRQVLLVDSLAAMWGGFCSASSVTTYIESAAGVGEGGRTGLTTVVVGLLFLAATFLAPLAQAVPPEATAPALILVGFLMMSVAREIDYSDWVAAIPAFLILLVVPLTMSISRGIGIGFISYALLALFAGRGRQVPAYLWILAAVFALGFYLEPAGR